MFKKLRCYNEKFCAVEKCAQIFKNTCITSNNFPYKLKSEYSASFFIYCCPRFHFILLSISFSLAAGIFTMMLWKQIASKWAGRQLKRCPSAYVTSSKTIGAETVLLPCCRRPVEQKSPRSRVAMCSHSLMIHIWMCLSYRRDTLVALKKSRQCKSSLKLLLDYPLCNIAHGIEIPSRKKYTFCI